MVIPTCWRTTSRRRPGSRPDGLMASFMSEDGGQRDGLNTVWTYDIYQSYIKRTPPTRTLLWIGRMTTISGSWTRSAPHTCRAVQQHHGLPAAGVRLRERAAVRDLPARMFWKARHGHGAFSAWRLGPWAALHHGLTLALGAPTGIKGGWLAASPWHTYPKRDGPELLDRDLGWSVCFLATIGSRCSPGS